MDDTGVNQLPVLEGQALVGVLTREDLLHLLSTHLVFGERGRE
jgi:CBS domain-containing protein